MILSPENDTQSIDANMYQSTEIKSGWMLQRLMVEIAEQPKKDTIKCHFHYKGNDEIYTKTPFCTPTHRGGGIAAPIQRAGRGKASCQA